MKGAPFYIFDGIEHDKFMPVGFEERFEKYCSDRNKTLESFIYVVILIVIASYINIHFTSDITIAVYNGVILAFCLCYSVYLLGETFESKRSLLKKFMLIHPTTFGDYVELDNNTSIESDFEISKTGYIKFCHHFVLTIKDGKKYEIHFGSITRGENNSIVPVYTSVVRYPDS